MRTVPGDLPISAGSGTMEAGSPNRQRWYARLIHLSSLQAQLIIPYVLLTLALAAVGTYTVTRLVTSSIRERFVNQLYNANGVAADGIVRQERTHLEILRQMAFTQGVAQALQTADAAALEGLLLPMAINDATQVVTAVDLHSQEVLSLAWDEQSSQYRISHGRDLHDLRIVQDALAGVVDERGDKFVEVQETSLGPTLFTSAPVRSQSGELSGVLLVGTPLKSLVEELYTQVMADIILLDPDRHVLATTLPEPEEGYGPLEAAVIDSGAQQNPLISTELNLDRRPYQVAYAPLIVRDENLGWLGVALPSNYVVARGVTSRNIFSALFALGTTAMAMVGYLLSRSIARPILRLRSLSQAVAAGDLNQQIGLKRSDEIGELAEAFDQMTLHLRERTAEAARLYAETVQRNKELAEINARLQAAQMQLVQSEKLASVGQLTAGIVHDVKNPLAVIKGLAELLQDDDEISDRAELEMIRESAVKANIIVTDLLKFARQSTPTMKYQDLGETVQAALRLTDYLIRKAYIQLIQDLPEKPLMATYDAQQIEQVLVNLIANAIHAMPDSGALRVSLSLVEGAAAITIQDTGVGIPPENLKRIFDPFFTTKPEGEGTGLGLSVSYGIISCHHGQIMVESTAGEGTTFTILLPLQQPDEIEKESRP